jgi:uncharacterized protein YnzC (UPF0291/DUF896 family)
MIAEEIARARQTKQKRLLTGLIVVIALALLAAILLYVVSNLSLVHQHDDAQPTAERTPNLATETTQTPGNEAALRQAYLEAFAFFENTLKPQLETIDIVDWDSALADSLKQQEKAALSAFAAGNYANAIKAMDGLTATAEKAITDSKSAYEQAMQEAQAAYQDDDYERARLAIDRAQMLDNSAKQARELAAQIERIPQINELKESIRVAKVENNASKELQLIEQLLKLDADRPVMQERAATLRSQQAETQFSQRIQQAYRAIENREPAQARQALVAAEKMYPARAAVSDVKKQLASLESQLRFETHTARALAAEKADDWNTAKQQLELAIKEKPADKAISDKLADAERIVSLSETLKRLQAAPFRLAKQQAKTEANIALIQAEAFTQKSPSLAKMRAQLESTIRAVNTPVKVTVLSDDNTFVSVRGVGNVGTTSSKVIELKPGPYTFEGKRKGYKSKLVEVMIPIDVSTYQLRVVADERI